MSLYNSFRQIYAVAYRRYIIHRRSQSLILWSCIITILSSITALSFHLKSLLNDNIIYNPLTFHNFHINSNPTIAFIANPEIFQLNITKEMINDIIEICNKDLNTIPNISYFYSQEKFNNWVYDLNTNETKSNINLIFGLHFHNNTKDSHISLTYLYNNTLKTDKLVFSQVLRILHKRMNRNNKSDFLYNVQHLTSHITNELISSFIPFVVTFGLINICVLYVTQAIEDVSSEKRPYMTLCSLKLTNYWIGGFLVDFFEWTVIVFLFWIIYIIFKTPLFYNNLVSSFLVLVLSGPGFILTSYCISFIFKSPETGANYAIFILLLLFGVFTVSDLTPNKNFNKILSVVGKLYPPANLCFILTDFGNNSFERSSFLTFPVSIAFLSLFLWFIEWTVTFTEENSTVSEFQKYSKLFKETKIQPVDPESVKFMEDEVNFNSTKTHNLTQIHHNSIMNDNIYALKIKRVSRLYFSNFKPVPAVNDLSLCVKKGSTFGLLGANGSGKTTLMKMILNRIPVSAGKIEIDGVISYCPQFDDHLSPELTALENLKFYGTIFGLSDSEIQDRSNFLIDSLDLRQHSNKPVKVMSGGTQRKVSVAVAFLSNSNIIILDEPTSSLDSTARSHVHKLIHSQKGQKTFVLCTHLLNEVDLLCDEITIMINGSICAFGSPRLLTGKFGMNWKIDVHLQSNSEDDKMKLHNYMINHIPACVLVSDRQKTQVYNVPVSSYSLHDVFRVMNQAKIEIPTINHFTCVSSTLETVFIEILIKSNQMHYYT
ncbi:ABC transporter family protein [Tritrichomonas foetus]|uniref:ABC transporter family protein n=1 Tax=Tritrichomonas foetus TaxID=1144522 RepID=A0A1J4JQX9_9EUKA|nr:ABC transporter family protein [Tritrichomonas foetus]|eukprot:OHT01154.1 ABC transporter family protein [Tritrichomonas foetus]